MASEVRIKIKAKNEATGEFRKAEADAKKTTDKISADFKKMSSNILAGVKATASFGASLASVASLAGPALSGVMAMAHGVAALGSALVAMAPAATVLPGLAASLGFLALTVKAAMPGITSGLKPIGDSFGVVNARVATLASRGLPDLARQFVKVNMPTIAGDMEWIARSLNAVVTNTMKWVNSVNGQDAVRVIADSTAEAFERLVKPLDHVVQSFGNMVGRVSGNTIGGLADVIGRAADATARWMDSITVDKVNEATAAIHGYGGKIRDTFTALKDMGEWMASHQGQVKAFSDALATAGIALGVATGNIPAILTGTFSLVVNHWNDIKGVFAQGAAYISGIWNAIRNDPSAQAIWQNVKLAVKDMVDAFRQYLPQIKEQWNSLIANLKQAWAEWGPTIAAWWQNVGRPVFSALGTALAAFIAGLLTVSSAAASWGAFMGSVFRGAVSVILGALQMIVSAAAIAFGWIPGIGPKLQNAANEFTSFRNRVNETLAGIRDRNVNVTITERRTTIYNTEGRYAQGSAFATGGIVGAASGGVRNNMTLVGEHGPELVNLRPGTMVTPAGKTRSMLNAASDKTSEPIVLVVSGGSQMDDVLVDILRRAISRRGGDVQTALGTS